MARKERETFVSLLRMESTVALTEESGTYVSTSPPPAVRDPGWRISPPSWCWCRGGGGGG